MGQSHVSRSSARHVEKSKEPRWLIRRSIVCLPLTTDEVPVFSVATSCCATDHGLRVETNPSKKENQECLEILLISTICSSAC